MKNFILFFIVLGQTIVFAQSTQENISFTYAEFRGGYGISSFGEGLKERFDAGNFSTSGGFLATLAAYHKFKKINSLVFGIKYKSLGASPSNGDNSEQMFFNYWGAALSTKFFPMDRNASKGIYLQGDLVFITQFTQKYRISSKQIFDHQFAIGNGLALGIGYDFPITKGNTMLTLGLEYQWDSRAGEVTGYGAKSFKSSNLGLLMGIKF